jgi:hypothetical protein
VQRTRFAASPTPERWSMARGDLSSTTNRAPGARPAAAFSTVEEAHTGLIERLAGSKPRSPPAGRSTANTSWA